jgi:hypothetical protein
MRQQQIHQRVAEQGWFGPKKLRSVPGPGVGGRPQPWDQAQLRRGIDGFPPQTTAVKDRQREQIVATALADNGTIDGRKTLRIRRPRPAGGGLFVRNRKQLLPHGVACSLWLLVGLTHAIDMAVAVWAASTGLIVAGVLSVLSLRRSNKLPSGWTAWALTLVISSGAWCAVVGVVGWSWESLAGLLVLDVIFGARWWARHHHPNPGGKPRGRNPVRCSDVPTRWRDTIAISAGALPESLLVNGKATDHGMEYTLRLKPGKHDLADVLGAMRKIASGLETPVEQLLAEAHSSRNPALVRLQIVTASPVEKPVFFTEPEFVDGSIILGPYVDGVSRAPWRMYTHKSMWGGMVIGGTGSGKSRLLEVIALTAMHTELTYVVHVDGQGGQSCPLLWKHAPERYGSDDMDVALTRLEAMQHYRQRRSGELGKSGFKPSPDYPGILVVVDEAHAVITSETVERWSILAREARKVGIAVVMGDQDGSLETFRKDVLRSSLQAGNTIGMHTDSRQAGQIIADGKFNLRDLPGDMPGFGYTIGAKGSGVRTAPYRGYWLPDADDAQELAEQGKSLPTELRLIDDWYESAPVVELDAGTSSAADGHGGTPAPLPVQVKEMAMPTVATPSDGLSDSERKVLDAVRGGTDNPSGIAKTVGISRQQVTTLLARLADAKLVRRAEYGRYEAVDRKSA